MRQYYLLLPTLLDFALQGLATAARQQKEIRNIKIENWETKLSNYLHNRMVHVYNLKKSADKLLEIISELRDKVSLQKSIVFLYTYNKQFGNKNLIHDTIYNNIKHIKWLGINHERCWRTLHRKLKHPEKQKKTYINERYYRVHWLDNSTF